jgi:cysteine desulfurase family protein (TIGR01976 family)
MSTAAPATTTLDLTFIRNQFPALKNGFVFMDNAGGSQTAGAVIERITEYLCNYNVQLGASYKTSDQAGKALAESMEMMRELINAKRTEEVVLGGSSTLLLRILSLCLLKQWKPGDEVIITNSEHEANGTCWRDLQAHGIVVKTWKLNANTLEFNLDDLKALMTDRTKLVTMVHTSNILGTINPIKEAAKVTHDGGALFCVDGVAFAPHRMVDVQEFDADFYVYSCYKVFGPHIGMLYGRYELLHEMDGLNHYFLGKDAVPYKFQPGNFNYELAYGLGGMPKYLEAVHDHHYATETRIARIDKYHKSHQLFADHEEILGEKLLNYLGSRSDVRILGHQSAAQDLRVPTIAFAHNSKQSPDIVKAIDDYGIGIRFGDFYAKGLVDVLGLEKHGGAVRVSFAHYNTVEEVERLIAAFEEVL